MRIHLPAERPLAAQHMTVLFQGRTPQSVEHQRSVEWEPDTPDRETLDIVDADGVRHRATEAEPLALLWLHEQLDVYFSHEPPRGE